MTSQQLIPFLTEYYSSNQLTGLEHALQTGFLLAQEGCEDALVCAGLLHDLAEKKAIPLHVAEEPTQKLLGDFLRAEIKTASRVPFSKNFMSKKTALLMTADLLAGLGMQQIRPASSAPFASEAPDEKREEQGETMPATHSDALLMERTCSSAMQEQGKEILWLDRYVNNNLSRRLCEAFGAVAGQPIYADKKHTPPVGRNTVTAFVLSLCGVVAFFIYGPVALGLGVAAFAIGGEAKKTDARNPMLRAARIIAIVAIVMGIFKSIVSIAISSAVRGALTSLFSLM